MLADLEPDIEGLIVNRLADPPAYVIAPIDRCYELTGTIKAALGGDLGRCSGRAGGRWILLAVALAGGGRVSSLLGARSNGDSAPPSVPEPEFEVVGARPVKYAAAPMFTIDLQVSESSGRAVYMIALSIQLMIEPARRRYDDETRERLLELFGPPERWAVTTRSLVWSQVDVIVPAFTGSTTVSVPIACNYDLELAATKYLHSLPDGEAPPAMHFNGTIYYPGDDGGLQMVLVPWTKSIDFRLPISVWRETVDHYYPNTGWVALRTETLEALQRAKLDRGLATLDAAVAALIEEGRGER